MARALIGVFLLIFLLLAGILIQAEMELIHRPTARMLEVSADDALDGSWDSARNLFSGARSRWQKYWQFSAAFADHAPMEQIDSLFSRLSVFSGESDPEEFAASGRELSRMIDAMADAHTLRWWNLF